VSTAPVAPLHLHEAGHGQAVRCPSPCVMYPLPPHSVQQPGLGGSGVGSGAFSCAVVAYAAETAAEALGASRSICAGSAASDASTDSSHCHMITTLARD
jgi:hypothetical protein